MKAYARFLAWGILGLLAFGLAGTGQDGSRLYGHGEVWPLPAACPLGPGGDACCPANVRPPVVALKVRVPAFSPPGKEIHYKICVENLSTAEAHHVIVRNPVPANAKFVRAEPPPSVQDTELIWRFGTIGGGGCREIDLVLAPTDKEDVKNCARVVFEHGQCVTTRQAAYPQGVPPDGGPHMPPVPADGEAKLNLDIQGPAKRYVNLPASYFITVRNTGNAPATNLLIKAFLPEKGKFTRASGDGRFALNQVAWVVGTLGAGASRTVEVEMKALAVGELCIKAEILADRGVTAKPAEFCTLFTGQSALTPELIDTKDPIAVGESTSYKILVENQGSVPLTNVQIQANLSPHLSFRLMKGEVRYKLGDPTPKGQLITFEPIPSLEAGGKIMIEVFAAGVKPGDARCRLAVLADQLKEGGPVQEEESTTIYRETEAPEGRALSRRESMTD